LITYSCSRQAGAAGQPQHEADEHTEYLIRDQLSFMRVLGLGLAGTVQNANTIWTCEALTRARLGGRLHIIVASIVAAPKQHRR
jgi:hypothetical protein